MTVNLQALDCIRLNVHRQVKQGISHLGIQADCMKHTIILIEIISIVCLTSQKASERPS